MFFGRVLLTFLASVRCNVYVACASDRACVTRPPGRLQLMWHLPCTHEELCASTRQPATRGYRPPCTRAEGSCATCGTTCSTSCSPCMHPSPSVPCTPCPWSIQNRMKKYLQMSVGPWAEHSCCLCCCSWFIHVHTYVPPVGLQLHSTAAATVAVARWLKAPARAYHSCSYVLSKRSRVLWEILTDYRHHTATEFATEFCSIPGVNGPF